MTESQHTARLRLRLSQQQRSPLPHPLPTCVKYTCAAVDVNSDILQTENSPVQNTSVESLPAESSPTEAVAADQSSCSLSEVTTTETITSTVTASITVTVSTTPASDVSQSVEETTTLTNQDTATLGVTATATGTNPTSLVPYPTIGKCLPFGASDQNRLTLMTGQNSTSAFSYPPSESTPVAEEPTGDAVTPTPYGTGAGYATPSDSTGAETTSPIPFTGGAAHMVSGAGMMALIAAPMMLALF